jgi:hypothetical protein
MAAMMMAATAAPAFASGYGYEPPTCYKDCYPKPPEPPKHHKKACNAGGGNGSEYYGWGKYKYECDPGNSGNTPAADND